MPYLLDSDWGIRALAGHDDAARTLDRVAEDVIAISWFTVAEVYEGAFSSVTPSTRLMNFHHFVSSYFLLTPDDEVAAQFAELRAYLRRRGELIPDFDLLIAATAIRHGLTLLTCNLRHMSRVPDLKVFSVSTWRSSTTSPPAPTRTSGSSTRSS